jgi:hypothetical protein
MTTNFLKTRAEPISDIQCIANIGYLRQMDYIHVGFEVFTAVVMKSIIFWDMTPCSPLSCCTYFFNPEDGGDKFLRNVGRNSTNYMASYPRR